MPAPTRNYAALPKWARQEIARLTRDLESARAQLAAGPEESNTFADPYSEAPRPLGKDTTIEFHVGDNKLRVRIDRTSRGDEYIDVNGGDMLQIEPRASNGVMIRMRRFM